jgi:hypothetical protein
MAVVNFSYILKDCSNVIGHFLELCRFHSFNSNLSAFLFGKWFNPFTYLPRAVSLFCNPSALLLDSSFFPRGNRFVSSIHCVMAFKCKRTFRNIFILYCICNYIQELLRYRPYDL